MPTPLKDQNRLGLYTAVVANLALYIGTARSGALFGGDWAALAESLPAMLPAGLGLVLVGILSAQIDGTAKARLVFRRWRNPLPASDAFSRLGPADARVDMGALTRDHGPLPTDAAGQNALWFRLYRSIEDQPAVSHAHREYLFARDYHFLSALILIGLGVMALFTFDRFTTALAYVGIHTVQFLITGQAARNHGRRLVCTVLARKAAEEPRS